MDQAQFITILLSLIAVLFAIVALMVGWMGNKLYSKLGEMARAMHNIESDLHGRISNLDRRVTITETKVARI